MQNTQGMQALAEFVGLHGRAVVGHERPRQPAFLESLTQTMNQGLGGLIPVPLQMTHQAGAVVDHAE
jgi:hypothetical protein